MCPDRLSFPSIPSVASEQPRLPARADEGTAFAAFYSEAMQAASQQLSQIVPADVSDSDSPSADDDSMSFLELRSAASAFGAPGSFLAMNENFSEIQDELMQHVAAIRLGQTEGATSGNDMSETTFTPSTGRKTETPITNLAQHIEGSISSGVHRLISWLDAHAHLHSTHQCAASVRQAMEAAGIQTADRPPSGDAGDYGPFLLRHGAQVISTESYEPKAGDIAVFDRTDDHPAGHIQVFDGKNWVSDFVQHTFSPYRDQASTPPVTVYRMS
jgi:hypothetical protein